MSRVLMSLLALFLVSFGAAAQETAKPAQETRPADPRPAVTELNLNVNPDTQFYRLSTGSRMENNGTNSWKLNTLGFRELRFVAFMGADSKKDNRATGSSLLVTMVASEGDQEIEIGEIEVPISAGKSSGRAFVWNVFTNVTTIRVATKNISGSVYMTAYVVK